jgi:glycyl-tRNA synthetase beta chain
MAASPWDYDFVRLLSRAKALQAFVGTADGATSSAGYKRAANYLKNGVYEALPAHAGDRWRPRRDAVQDTALPGLPRERGPIFAFPTRPAERAP